MHQTKQSNTLSAHTKKCISYVHSSRITPRCRSCPLLYFSRAGGYLSPFCICLLACFVFWAGSLPSCLGNPGYPLSACAPSGPREYTKVSAIKPLKSMPLAVKLCCITHLYLYTLVFVCVTVCQFASNCLFLTL